MYLLLIAKQRTLASHHRSIQNISDYVNCKWNNGCFLKSFSLSFIFLTWIIKVLLFKVRVFCTSSTVSFNTQIHCSVTHALIQDSTAQVFSFLKKMRGEFKPLDFEAHSLALWLDKFVFIKTLFPQQTALCSTSRCLLLRSHNYCDSQPIIQQVEMNTLLQLCCRFNWGSKLMSKSYTSHISCKDLFAFVVTSVRRWK